MRAGHPDSKGALTLWPPLYILLPLVTMASGQNPEYTLIVEGPGDRVIEGPPGAQYDDGTFGAPEFDRGGVGHTWEIKLEKKKTPPGDWGKTSGWQWSIGAEGMAITAITRNGTITCHAGAGPLCIGGGAFNQTTELTGAPDGQGPRTEENHGASSAVLLGIDGSWLPEDGIWTIAKIRVTAVFPELPGAVSTGRLFFAERTGSTGVPTPQVVYYSAVPITPTRGEPPLSLEDFTVQLKAVSPAHSFIRCDVNRDGLLDLSDSLWLLRELFQAGERTECPATRDCDGDGEVNITDPIYSLLFLFLGGPPPAPPFPTCGTVEDPRSGDCPEDSTICP